MIFCQKTEHRPLSASFYSFLLLLFIFLPFFIFFFLLFSFLPFSSLVVCFPFRSFVRGRIFRISLAATVSAIPVFLILIFLKNTLANCMVSKISTALAAITSVIDRCRAFLGRFFFFLSFRPNIGPLLNTSRKRFSAGRGDSNLFVFRLDIRSMGIVDRVGQHVEESGERYSFFFLFPRTLIFEYTGCTSKHVVSCYSIDNIDFVH